MANRVHNMDRPVKRMAPLGGAVRRPSEISYPTPSELNICTLESTYRTSGPFGIAGPRRFVSESDICMQRECDWYREPAKMTACESVEVYPSRQQPMSFNIVSSRYPAADENRVETFTTRFQSPGNVLVRFKSFLGIEGSTQRVEVVADPEPHSQGDGSFLRMKHIFSKKSLPDVGDVENKETFKSKMISMFPKKRTDIENEVNYSTGPAGRIIRMKSFFANRQTQGEQGTENATNKFHFFTRKTDGEHGEHFNLKWFKKRQENEEETEQQQDSREKPRNKIKAIFKPIMRTKENSDVETEVKADNNRQIFSRQSTLPASVDDSTNDNPRRLPVFLDDMLKRMRASLSGSRVHDTEIPDTGSEPQSRAASEDGSRKRRRFGSRHGWRFRKGRVGDQRGWSASKWFNCDHFNTTDFHPSSWLYRKSRPNEPAPVVQVIALICGILVVVLMALGLTSADWLMAAGWRQGLFTHCIEPDATKPLPFNLDEQPGCHGSRDVGYIKAAAYFCIVTLCSDIIGTILTGFGLRASDHRAKFKYYRFAVLAMALALITILIALVIYPVCFAAELNLGNRTVWEFGWAYGVGWGAAIFLFGAVILLLCDKESEEIYYKERKVEREPPGGP